MNDLYLHPQTKQRFDLLLQDFPQSLILTGPTGVGVATAAHQLAKALGSSRLTIVPKKRLQDGRKLVEDAENGSIIIEDIRELYEHTRTKVKTKQVFVIDFADRTMTVQAQNAFLKLLEEPRPNYYFILATHRPSDLLTTIRSRSQRVDMLPITDQQTNELLDTLQVTDAMKRTRLSFVAKGRPAEIVRLLESDSAYESRIAIAQDAKQLIGGSTYEKLVIIHKYKDNRTGAVTLVDDMNLQLKSVLASTADPRYAAAINNNLKTRDKLIANGNIRLQLARNVI
jgi:replication-associated recombination protein RarA